MGLHLSPQIRLGRTEWIILLCFYLCCNVCLVRVLLSVDFGSEYPTTTSLCNAANILCTFLTLDHQCDFIIFSYNLIDGNSRFSCRYTLVFVLGSHFLWCTNLLVSSRKLLSLLHQNLDKLIFCRLLLRTNTKRPKSFIYIYTRIG